MLANIDKFKDPGFKKNVFQTIIDMCTHNNYENITSFEWLVNNVLFVLA